MQQPLSIIVVTFKARTFKASNVNGCSGSNISLMRSNTLSPRDLGSHSFFPKREKNYLKCIDLIFYIIILLIQRNDNTAIRARVKNNRVFVLAREIHCGSLLGHDTATFTAAGAAWPAWPTRQGYVRLNDGFVA